MAKKKEEKQLPKVRCLNCAFGGTVDNYLIGCSNKEANPGGYKKGTWEHICKYYKGK